MDTDARVPGIEIGEAEIARSEIKLFVIERIVGDMHLAVFAEERTVGIEDRAGVVIDTGSAALEYGNDQGDFLLFGDLPELFGCGTGDGLGKVEQFGVFGAAKVFAEKQFVQRNDLGAARGGFADFFDCFREILFRVLRAIHLHESNGKFAGHENQFTMSRKENIYARFVVSFAQRL